MTVNWTVITVDKTKRSPILHGLLPCNSALDFPFQIIISGSNAFLLSYFNFLLQRTHGRPKHLDKPCIISTVRSLLGSNWNGLQQSVTATSLHRGITPARSSPQLMQVWWARQMHSFVATWYRYLRNWRTIFICC